MGCPEYERVRKRKRERERNLCSEEQCIALGIAEQRYATARRGSAGVLPLNRVALFAAQITRESLDTRAPVESKATTTIGLRIVPYLGITRLVSRRFSFSYFLTVPLRSTKYASFFGNFS